MRVASVGAAVTATAFATTIPATAGRQATLTASSTAGTSATAAAPTGGAAACKAVAEGRVKGLSKPKRATLVLASRYDTSYATLTECVKSGSGYRVDYSVPARIGYNGFAPRGAKREGDGMSPSGVNSWGHGFGAKNPGSTSGYKKITSRSCWVDTPGSRYNTWQETSACRGEQMAKYLSRDYNQGIVINHNIPARQAGMGSAIFLHASGSGSTAGCVSVSKSYVVKKMRSITSGDRIAMGVASDMIAPATTSGPSASGKIAHTLRRGSPYRAEVRILQRKLGVAVDGLFGPGTEAAVKRFQRSKNLGVDGIVGPNTRRVLNVGQSQPAKPTTPAPSVKVTHTLRRGSPYRAEVRILQRKLGMAVDGLFGPGTEAAVMRFQRSKRLGVDGIAGPNTLRVMKLR